MKHPLTSKERKGLVAVAAAALLCIATGPVLRSCGLLTRSYTDSPDVAADVVKTTEVDTIADKKDISKSHANKSHAKSKEGKNKSGKKTTKKKAAKEYPVRSPLDQPCDI